MPAPGLVVEEIGGEGTHRLILKGELDLVSAEVLEAAIDELCAEKGIQRMTIDMRGLAFIDSTGMRTLMSTSARCRALGCELLLIPGPSNVQRPFELTGLVDVLPFGQDGPDAAAP
jgi:anti-anti-sigma factor